MNRPPTARKAARRRVTETLPQKRQRLDDSLKAALWNVAESGMPLQGLPFLLQQLGAQRFGIKVSRVMVGQCRGQCKKAESSKMTSAGPSSPRSRSSAHAAAAEFHCKCARMSCSYCNEEDIRREVEVLADALLRARELNAQMTLAALEKDRKISSLEATVKQLESTAAKRASIMGSLATRR